MSGFVQNPAFSNLWGNLVSKLDVNKSQQGSSKPGQQMPGTATSPVCNDLLSPRLRGSSRYTGLNIGVSPGDVEASQDIFWDSTSPTQNPLRLKNTNDVKISDIVNRIAPKNIKPKGSESSLSRWIDDGTILSTPGHSNQNGRKKSSRQSNVEDLLKLARQFDENMQQNEETSEQLNSVNTDRCKSVNTSDKPPTPSLPSNVKNPKCPSSSDQAEAELHALFDCSTQGASGRLSEGSVWSQEMPDQPVSEGFAKRQQTELKPADKSGTAEQKETCSPGTKNCVEFCDDWENDDLLNDSFILAITQNPNGLDANPETTLKSHTETNSKLPVLNSDSAQSFQELCPKSRSTNRNTFRLKPNPHFQSKLNKEVSKANFTVIQPKPKMTVKNSAIPKMLPAVQPNSVPAEVGAPSVKDVSDSLWDSGDDELLYQVCDSLERISDNRPKEVNPNNYRENQEVTVDCQLKTTRFLPNNTAGSVLPGVSANNRRSSGTFVRSNSLPGTSCNASYQGWTIPMNGTNSKSGISQSFPESRVGQDTFNHSRDFSGTFQARNGNMDTKLQTLTTRGPHISTSHQTAFKRNVSDSAVIRNKVFVTSQTTGKCSAAEIEKKKQEALARRRLRMNSTSKP